MSYRIPTGIVQHLRAWGLTVTETSGWQTRGADFPAQPLVIVDHHTGTPDSAKGDYPTLNVVINGRSDLQGPLCQFGLGRSGTVYLIAAGKANHAGKGAWDGVNVGNSRSVGVEAESAGGGRWTRQQLEAYPILNAALCAFFTIPARRVCAHRESALPHGRKDDPVGIDMDVMRAKVAQLLTKQPEGDELTADDLKKIQAMIDAAVEKVHHDLVIILHGDDKGHVNSIDSIAKQVGVPQK